MSTTSLLPSPPRKPSYGTLQAPPPTTTTTTASWLSKLLFSYASPVMASGNQRQLANDDLWELEGDIQSQHAYETFKAQFNRSHGAIIPAMLRTYGALFVWCGFASLFSMGCTVLAPAVLRYVIEAFTAPQLDTYGLSLWLTAFFVSKLLNAVVSAQTSFHIELVALRLTVAVKSLLFEKAMRRSIASKHDAKAVDLANLFSSDISSVLYAAFQVNNLWVLPIQVTVIMVMLYNVIGWAVVAGLAVMGISMYTSGWVSKQTGGLIGEIMERLDPRTRAVKEVFGAIQVVKLNAWESKFANRILKLRAFELEATAKFMYLSAVGIVILWASPLFVSMSSFAVYAVVMGEQLTAAKVFTAMALFNALRAPLSDFPNVITQCMHAKVSLDRMQSFLALPEYDPSNVVRSSSEYPEEVAIDVSNGAFGWTKETPLLKNVNITAKKGDFVVIHGAVGAGKSSLCSALLGEMEKLNGSVFVRGRVAYYSQQTWIQNLTIRENILFGNTYDEKRYHQVLDVCGLLPDLAQFPAGDLTEIGQKGINLSGGQKARVCLARACYSDADVLILDSPLAAVDAVVQNEIFNKCLCTLLESKTVVLVTHSQEIITSKAANYKVEMVNGQTFGVRSEPKVRRSSHVRRVSPRRLNDVSTGPAVSDLGSGRLVQDEEREEGRVSKAVFATYFKAVGGVHICVFLFVVQLLWQAFQISSDLWLSHWTGQKLGVYDQDRAMYNLRVYVALGIASAFMVFIRSFTAMFVGLRASKHLFTTMTYALLHAPMRFFDANPIGRIVNRFDDDIGNVDWDLPFGFGSFLATLFFTVCQLATAIYTVNVLGLLIVPLVYVYVKVASFYLAPSREISRLRKVAASPVLTYITGAEEGVALIRAFGGDYVRRVVAETFHRNDVVNRAWFAETVMNQWFQVRMQLIGSGVVMVVVLSLVYLREFLTPGVVGLAFTYALSVDGGIASLVRGWSQVEIAMVSPERILEYASIEPEGATQVLQLDPAKSWPHAGAVEFKNVEFSYKPGAPAVLKNVSFSIKANEKIGIVGRTGAGKSSLAMALFRINELDTGRVLVDDVDISTLSLQALRSKMSIISQSPVMFKGPLRGFMDPFDEYSDAQIWEAFEKVEMKHQISTLDGQLAHELTENGDNFSVGERQMLCLARAMLNKSKIIVMDEATASIDHETEKKLQHMIARDFENATVLTIAHRLTTVLNSDRILVVSDGRVVEFDTPRNLLKTTNGVFYELAKEAGVLNRV